MSIRVVNNFSTTLASALVPGGTSMVMAAGAGNALRTKLTGSPSTAMAAGDYLYHTLADSSGNIEIVKITALPSSGDTCTIVRGLDGTTSRATDWPAGSTVDARPCAAFFVDAMMLLGTTAAGVTYDDTSASITAANVQAAIDALDALHTALLASLPAFGTAATKNVGEAGGVQSYDANTAKLNVKQSFTAQQTPKSGALTPGATIDWNGDGNGQIVTLTLDRSSSTLNAPTNIVQNTAYLVRVKQPSSGGPSAIVWNTAYKFGATGAPTLSTAANAVDFISFVGGAGNTLECLGVRLNAVT